MLSQRIKLISFYFKFQRNNKNHSCLAARNLNPTFIVLNSTAIATTNIKRRLTLKKLMLSLQKKEKKNYNSLITHDWYRRRELPFDDGASQCPPSRLRSIPFDEVSRENPAAYKDYRARR
ncbi:hypothetical protein PUN28_018784 [Cardiocondyla obscurior]|uniref:Uncharacterized protein n=1 Tax=Cardiocondyla obscurior TaxID=286306 RepID=A0AAW2ECR2_9HYME